MTILYNLRKTSTGYLMAKFDNDFNVEAVYELSQSAIEDRYGQVIDTKINCSCPAGPRPSCKHRKMIGIMSPRADSEWFYCYETQAWHTPLVPKGVEPMADKLGAFYATLDEVTAKDEPTIESYRELGPNEDVAEEFSKLLAPTGVSQATGPSPKLFGEDGIMEPPYVDGTPVREVESILPQTFKRRV